MLKAVLRNRIKFLSMALAKVTLMPLTALKKINQNFLIESNVQIIFKLLKTTGTGIS
jgi:hypothetical protein